jgi:hypothetical protein
MAKLEVEVQIAEYITVSSGDSLSTEFVDSEGRRKASCGLRRTGRPHDVVARICYEDGRRCFVRGRTKAGRELVERIRAA